MTHKLLRTMVPALVFGLGMGVVAQPVYATPEGQDELILHTSAPQKSGETIISITAQWRTDKTLRYEATGLTFINGLSESTPDDAASVAHKLGNALKEGMEKQYPSWRGIIVTEDGGSVSFKNKEGHSLTEITIRDFTNQVLTSETNGATFAADGVQIGVDLVAADSVSHSPFLVEKSKKAFKATGGGIEITVGDKAPVKIETKNRSSEQIEKDIASKTSGSFSRSTIVPNTNDGDARNVQPFDRGEVLFSSLAAKKLTINITDPSVAVLMKYKYKDENADPGAQLAGWAATIIFSLAGLGVLYFFFKAMTKKEEGEEKKEGEE